MATSAAAFATATAVSTHHVAAASHLCKRKRPHQPVTTPATHTHTSTIQNINEDSSNRQQQQQDPRNVQTTPGELPPLFVGDVEEEFFASTNVDDVFAPLSDEDEQLLRSKLPNRLAQFFIDRADDANRLRQPPSSKNSSPSLFSDLPPDTPDWDDPVNAEYSDYVYVTTTGAPAKSFRRKSSSIFGGGDGLPDPDEDTGLIGKPYVDQNGADIIRPIDNPQKVNPSPPRVVSLFVGQVDSIDEQASRLGYGIIAILAFSFILKLIFAVISFFLSFTFSFFAIFALSAGIFVLFFVIRF